MRVLHVVAANRWTGAAAPAFNEVDALRAAGIEADYAYVGGYKLQHKLAAVPFAHPLIAKRENPVAMMRSFRALQRFIDRENVQIVHSHLSYDQALTNVLRWRRPALRIVRTFHSRRAARVVFASRADAVCAVNADLALRDATFTPPPVDHHFFTPDGPSVRDSLKVPLEVPLLGAIGKIAPHRGFEDVLRTFAVFRDSRPGARLMIIGHGPHQRALQHLATRLDLESDVIWAGYHETDLPEYFRALDLLLFTHEGSDEGHRAISEALACGVPVAAYPLPGVRLLLGSLSDASIPERAQPEDLAMVAETLLARGAGLHKACIDATQINSYVVTAQRLTRIYEDVLNSSQR